MDESGVNQVAAEVAADVVSRLVDVFGEQLVVGRVARALKALLDVGQVAVAGGADLEGSRPVRGARASRCLVAGPVPSRARPYRIVDGVGADEGDDGGRAHVDRGAERLHRIALELDHRPGPGVSGVQDLVGILTEQSQYYTHQLSGVWCVA